MGTEIMKNRFGFTVFELMIVMAIVAIVTAIMAPSVMGYMERKGVTDASDQLFTDMYKTKSLAIKKREIGTINFDLANHNYQVTFTDPVTGAVTNPTTVSFGDYRGGVRITTDPGGGAPLAATIAFNHRGVCPAGSSGAIYLTNSTNTIFYRIRTTLAGGISIHRWNATSGRWTTK